VAAVSETDRATACTVEEANGTRYTKIFRPAKGKWTGSYLPPAKPRAP
jgi:hypothetical protein